MRNAKRSPGDAKRSPGDAKRSLGDQYNTAYGGSVYASQGGDIHISGAPAQVAPAPVQKPGPAEPLPVEPLSAAERIRILLLAANPLNSGRLAIDEEARQITERLRLSQDRDAFELLTCLAVRPMDLLQYLNQYRPHIVHFSGHGSRTGEIVLSAGDGTGRLVSAAALAELLRVANDEIRVVVLNACHSAAAVQAIGRYVDYVVGMPAPITDEAATIFAATFYSALGFRRTIPAAFDQAVAALGLPGPVGQPIPELAARPHASPHLTKGAP